MSRIQDDQLRALLYRRAKAASDEAIDAGGEVPAAQLEALERLGRLVKVCEGVQPPPPRKRWPLAAALGATLLIVSALLFARIPETEVELELAVAEVGFVLPTQQVLADVMDLSALGVARLERIQLPRTRDLASRLAEAPAGAGQAIRLSASSDGVREGTVNLAALTLPAETRVRLQHMGAQRQYRLSLQGDGLDLRVGVHGPTQIGLAGAPAEQLDFAIPRSILLQPGSGEVDVDLTLPEAAPVALTPLLSVTALSLFRIDEFTDPERTVVRRVSAILSGTLYLESLDGQAQSLRPGQALHFEEVRGEIRTLQLQADHIALQFHGHVRGMSTGTGETRRSLMPTYLEWLQARHGLSLLWGTALYLFALVAGVLRWWGMRI